MQFLTGPMTQLAWIVDDLEKAEATFAERDGVTRWTRLPDIHFGPEETTLRGAPADYVAHISLAYVGDLQLELIQPVRGESIYAEFLAERGPGSHLHHVCFDVADLDTALAGQAVVTKGSMADGEIRFAYVDRGLGEIPFIELVQLGPGMRAFFDAIKAQEA